MKVEYGQSPRTPGAKAAEDKAIKDKAAKDLAAITNPTTVKPTPKELADEKTAREKAKKDKDPDVKDGEIHNMASIVSLFQRYASGSAVRPGLNRKGEPIIKERENVGESVFKMLFTGDAHDRDCTLRNTVDAFVGGKPQRVDVLKVDHHPSPTVMSRLYVYIYHTHASGQAKDPPPRLSPLHIRRVLQTHLCQRLPHLCSPELIRSARHPNP